MYRIWLPSNSGITHYLILGILSRKYSFITMYLFTAHTFTIVSYCMQPWAYFYDWMWWNQMVKFLSRRITKDPNLISLPNFLKETWIMNILSSHSKSFKAKYYENYTKFCIRLQKSFISYHISYLVAACTKIFYKTITSERRILKLRPKPTPTLIVTYT